MQGRVALLSQEFGLSDRIPNFAGGLGILNGCMLNAFADLGYPVVGVGLFNKYGYFEQKIHDNGQVEAPVQWSPEKEGLERLPQRAYINLYGQDVAVAAWRGKVTSSLSGYGVDIIFLDTNLPENEGKSLNGVPASSLTDHLYDRRHESYELLQNLVLGLGGHAILQMLDYDIKTYHMQEGHSASLLFRLLQENKWNEDAVRAQCVFTNHTPISEGMPKFAYSAVKAAIGNLIPDEHFEHLQRLAGSESLNTNLFAARMSRYVNGVSRYHAEVLAGLPEFQGIKIDYITNGTHWRFISDRNQQLLDRTVKGDWRRHPELILAANISPDQLEAVHRADKRTLVDFVNAHSLISGRMDYDSFILGFAKRVATYKRPMIPIASEQKLKEMPGQLQIIYGGKAHPNDGYGRGLLGDILRTGLGLNHNVRFGFMPNYGIEMCRLLSGVDLWVVAAIPWKEASGTSAMKQGQNGNRTASTSGGFWPEVNGRFGDLGFTFDGNNDEKTRDAFFPVLRDAMLGKSNRLRVMQEFMPKFSATRMAREYAWVYGFEGAKLEDIVEQAALPAVA